MNSLYKHQIDFLKQNPNKSSLVHSCGTGKTRTSLEWSKLYDGNTLVICPKALKTNWQREADKCAAIIHVLTKEEFRKTYLVLARFSQVIVDEVHNGFLTPHFKSQMSKALRHYLKVHSVPRVLLCSATVYSSSPWNIYNLAFLTGHKWDWQKFNNTFFTQVRMGHRMIPKVKKGSETKLAEITKRIASVVSLEECVDVPAQTFETEYFDLTEQQKQIIKDNYDPLPIVRFTSHHQISNGVLKGNEFLKDISDIPSLKNERIVSLCNENDKVIIVCRYNMQIDALAKLLKSHRPMIIRGDVKDRDKVCQEAEKAEKAVVLIQSSCSMGFELPSFRIMVFASMDFSYTHYKQMCGRILRINNLQKNLYIHLIAGEMDQAILDAIGRKQDFNIALYDRICVHL